MDMTLSKRGDYVMRSAISLARSFEVGTHRKIREVVAETEVPQTFASQILADLVRSGLATSKAGRDGGYRLARPPAEISVLEVIEAAEGPLRSERCALGEGPCRWEAVCPLHETWSQATATLRELLSRTTLAEVAARDAAIEAGTYAVPADAHRSHPVAVDVADVVQVELSEGALDLALTRVTSVLGALAAAALEDGAAGLESVTPRSRRRSARVDEVSLVQVGPSSRDGEPARYLLVWQLAGSVPGSHLEAEVSLVALDAERSELRVEGTWRQDPDNGLLLAGPELERRARRTLRAFLRRLARALEEQPASSRRPPSPRSTALP